jgi:hypothetical protein
MMFLQLRPIGCLTEYKAVEGVAIGFDESKRAVVEDFNSDAAFVHKMMVEATQGDEVGEFCLAAIRPVVDVMTVDIAFVAAAGEATTFVA